MKDLKQADRDFTVTETCAFFRVSTPNNLPPARPGEA